jgi:DNA-binding response OmpR family regulator
MLRFGYATDWAHTGKEALVALAAHEYSCVLLDLSLPDISGEAVLKRIRASSAPPHVIVITGHGRVQDRIRLLDTGADDYMVKPVDLEELSARVRAVLRRRTAGHPPAAARPLVLNPSKCSAAWHGRQVSLTKREFWLLETFVRRRNEVLTRSQIEEALYSWGEEVASNTVEVHVHYLRRKFEPGIIETVRGVGYQLGARYQGD